MTIADIDKVDRFYKEVSFYIVATPDHETAQQIFIHDLPDPTTVFLTLWPLRQMPYSFKTIIILAEHDDIPTDVSCMVKIYRWRWLTKWRCIAQCNHLRYTLLKEAAKKELL